MNNIAALESLLLALALGCVIGYERQINRHEAGLKTNALVATGSALFMVVARFAGDPARVAAQIVSGVGFLGAGMILRDGQHVRGLNTAATLWCAAAIGTIAGLGQFAAASFAAATVLVANVVLRLVSLRVDARTAAKAAATAKLYTVRVRCAREAEGRVRALVLQGLASREMAVRGLQMGPQGAETEIVAEAGSPQCTDENVAQLLANLGLDPAVSQASWKPAEGK